jgi:prolyl-tRNA synthetase
MRSSQYYINTLKEAPADAEIISQKLMLRAGLIKKVASGIYTWLPLGLKVLRKVENSVRYEMNKVPALEILMPGVQPAELWIESGRWEQYGKELLRLKDRHDRDFCFGPTHEEVVVDLVKKDIKSYKQLPLTVYQIQTKFRDEVRPRFGVMRAREFIMKDAYSFHPDFASLEITYRQMYDAYSNIFKHLGLQFRAVNADTGSIGGTGSHEFQVLAQSGEDIIAYSDESNYAANIELAEAYLPVVATPSKLQELVKVVTPHQKTCIEVARLLNTDLSTTVKSLVFEGTDGKAVLILIRGDRELNEIKAAKIKELKTPLTFASVETITSSFKCSPGFIGPVGFEGLVIADKEVALMANFTCGANQDGFHYTNVNFVRDLKKTRFGSRFT